jgi:broad specificity phosphatase PhoE
MKLYFVRHGESAANAQQIIANRSQAYPLTANGRQQVQALAAALAEHTFSALYTSPIPRALETADILAQALGGKPQLTAALREPDMGELEGQAGPAVWRRHDEIYQRWWIDQDDEASIPGGESFASVKARFLPFIEGLLEEAPQLEAEVLLVGHAGLFTCMLPLLLKNVSNDFAQSHIPAYGSIILAESRVNGLSCLSWDGLTDFAPLY